MLIPPYDGQGRDYRSELDNALGVSGWGTPFGSGRKLPPRESGAPLWWQGEEEATARFMAARGLV